MSYNVMSVLTCGSQAQRRSTAINTLSEACSQGGNTSSESLSAMTVGTLTLWIHRSNGTSPNTEVSTRLGVKLRLPVWPWVCH